MTKKRQVKFNYIPHATPEKASIMSDNDIYKIESAVEYILNILLEKKKQKNFLIKEFK